MEAYSLNKIRGLVLLIGALVFLPFLGQAPLFDWDEINFAESAREMILTGNYARVQINFQPFWEKPPLFFWMQSISMSIFGVNEYAARFPNAVFGMLTLLSIVEIGRMERGLKFGLIWASCFLASFLPLVYFKSGIIDPVFNYFIFMSVWLMARAIRRPEKIRLMLYSGFCAGLAILTKGPVGALLPVLTLGAWIAYHRFRPLPSMRAALLWVASALLVSAFWFVPETIQNGPWFLEEFIRYQFRLLSTPDAGHGQPFYYHFLVVSIGCFPLSAFAWVQFFSKRGEADSFRIWMKMLFWVVMILFSLVTTKIVHYSSMAYLPMAYIATDEILALIKGKPIQRMHRVALVLCGLFIGLAMLLLPLAGNHPEWLMDKIQDPFARQNLEASVHWPWFTYIPGIIWFAGILFFLIPVFKNNPGRKFAVLFGANLLAGLLFLIWIPWRIASYTQMAAVDFYKSMQGKDVYVETLGFKSYAQYFYSDKQSISALEKQNSLDSEGNYHIDNLRDWLLKGNIDKPAYFVVKSIHEDQYLEPFHLQCVGRKNGFSFLLRPVPPQAD